MKYLLLIMVLFASAKSQMIFDFNKSSDANSWVVVDDVVMGGRSSGNFSLSKEGYGVFDGNVSLENNGGFSSVRHKMETTSVKGFDHLKMRVKGDGKNYQVRIKANSGDYHSYIAPFATSGDWEVIEIELSEMYPSFRGRKLNQPNFSHNHIEEIAFLIGNKKEQTFKLLLDKIYLE